MPEHSSFILVLTNLALILLLLNRLKPALYGKCSQNNVRLSYLLIFIFCMYSFWGADWFGYLWEFKAQKAGWNTHLEDFYKNLINNLSNYMQFRLVVWGGALIFLYLTLKKYDIDRGVALYCFVACSLIWFSYARVSLAMACMMYGASFFVTNESKLNLKTFPIGVFFLVLSVFFHKSAIFGALVVAISYLGLNSNKLMKKSLFALPFLVVFISGWLMNYMQMDVANEEGMMSQVVASGQNYMSKASTYSGIGTMIAHILEYLPKYMLMYICYRYSKDNIDTSPRMLFMINIFFYTMLFASIFLFDLGVNTNTIFIRFQRFAIIPMFIILAYFYETGYEPKLTRRTLTVATLGVLYAVAYSAYDAYLH